jgi:hypothetical protein
MTYLRGYMESGKIHSQVHLAFVLEVLDAFYLEHRRCGELDGGVDEDCVWLACPTCRTSVAHPA